jgi:hypothetical protein
MLPTLVQGYGGQGAPDSIAWRRSGSLGHLAIPPAKSILVLAAVLASFIIKFCYTSLTSLLFSIFPRLERKRYANIESSHP